MYDISLRCFQDFSCIADRCPDTCCAGWKVDIDPETTWRYRTLPGHLGEELRSRLIETEEGFSFRMDGCRCPFLNQENLCRLILAQGDGILSTTCREHPRFWEEYKDIRETVLSISCPEAARLLFTGDLALDMEETAEYLPDCDYDEELFSLLWQVREDYRKQLAAFLSFPGICQELLTTARELQSLCDNWFQLSPKEGYTGSIEGFLQMLETITFTDSRLPQKLKTAQWDDTLLNRYSDAARRLLSYFLYRYFLTAVWDGRILEKVLFCLYSVFAICALAENSDDLMAAAILYSREVEHSPENMRRIFEFLCRE